MSDRQFEAEFVLAISRQEAWDRLTARPLEPRDQGARYWLPGFDSPATVQHHTAPWELRAIKDDEPCAGTEIVVVLTDDDAGCRVRVVQSGFGDWMPPMRDAMAIGWRHIHADLELYLATGAHGARHLRPWGDLGSDAAPAHGGIGIREVAAGGLADRLGLRPHDVLITLGGAPVTDLSELVTVLRVLAEQPVRPVTAEWVRDGAVHSASDGPPSEDQP